MYGFNYIVLAPLRIPTEKRNRPHAINYAVSEPHSFDDAEDPSGTIFYIESKRAMDDTSRGSFVVNAPGMWRPFAENVNGLLAFWGGTLGSGDWVGTKTACATEETPCPDPQPSTNFVSTGYNDGANPTFLDGHVKYMKAAALAAGTDYATAVAGSQGDSGSGARIVNKKEYLWDLNGNYYGQ
jgi:prepilin-type processing-associated H-X9-DG protein